MDAAMMIDKLPISKSDQNQEKKRQNVSFQLSMRPKIALIDRPCLEPRCVAYEREKRKNPAERPAVNARSLAARNAKREKMNCAG
jgi:hypothetical protein